MGIISELAENCGLPKQHFASQSSSDVKTYEQTFKYCTKCLYETCVSRAVETPALCKDKSDGRAPSSMHNRGRTRDKTVGL